MNERGPVVEPRILFFRNEKLVLRIRENGIALRAQDQTAPECDHGEGRQDEPQARNDDHADHLNRAQAGYLESIRERAETVAPPDVPEQRVQAPTTANEAPTASRYVSFVYIPRLTMQTTGTSAVIPVVQVSIPAVSRI